MKKIFTIILSCLLLLTGCTVSSENATYSIKANEYSAFQNLPIYNTYSECISSNYVTIDIRSNLDLSTDYYMVDYCAYNDSAISIFTNESNYLIYNVGIDFSTKICDYHTNESIFINDMCYANGYVYWLETSYTTGNVIKQLNITSKEINTIASETETESFTRIYSDSKNIYCSKFNKDTQKWDICYYDDNHLIEYKQDIYVSNPYNPFYISDGYIQYLIQSEDTLYLQVENIESKFITTLNFSVKPEIIGINTIGCNKDYIAWRDIKNVTDYSSISTVIYNTTTGELHSTIVTDSKKGISSLTSGIIRDNLFIHYSSDHNGYSNIYIYSLKDNMTYDLTCNKNENVTFSYPKVSDNKLVFTEKENNDAVCIHIFEFI